MADDWLALQLEMAVRYALKDPNVELKVLTEKFMEQMTCNRVRAMKHAAPVKVALERLGEG